MKTINILVVILALLISCQSCMSARVILTPEKVHHNADDTWLVGPFWDMALSYPATWNTADKTGTNLARGTLVGFIIYVIDYSIAMPMWKSHLDAERSDNTKKEPAKEFKIPDSPQH